MKRLELLLLSLLPFAGACASAGRKTSEAERLFSAGDFAGIKRVVEPKSKAERTVDEQMLLAAAELRTGQYQAAVEEARYLKDVSPLNAIIAYDIMAGAYASMPDEEDKCIESAMTGAALKTDNIGDALMGELHHLLGSCYYDINYDRRAERQLEVAARYNPSALGTAQKLAEVYFWLQKYDKVLPLAEKIHDVAPGWADDISFYSGGVPDPMNFGAKRMLKAYQGFALGTEPGIYCVVSTVTAGSPAYMAGIRAGDTLTKYRSSAPVWCSDKDGMEAFYRSGLGNPREVDAEFRGADGVLKAVNLRSAPFPSALGDAYALMSLMLEAGSPETRAAVRRAFPAEAQDKLPEILYTAANDWDDGYHSVKLASTLHLVRAGKYAAALEKMKSLNTSTVLRNHWLLVQAMAYAGNGDLVSAGLKYASAHKWHQELLSPPAARAEKEFRALVRPLKEARRIETEKAIAAGDHKTALGGSVDLLRLASPEEHKTAIDRLSRVLAALQVPPALDAKAMKSVGSAAAYLRKAKFRQAADALRSAAIDSPYSARLYYDAARLYAAAGETSEAERYMEDYLALAPDGALAAKGRDYLSSWRAETAAPPAAAETEEAAPQAGERRAPGPGGRSSGGSGDWTQKILDVKASLRRCNFSVASVDITGLPRGADGAVYRVFDEKQNELRTFTAGHGLDADNHAMWDGLDSSGNPVPAGEYTLVGAAKGYIPGTFSISVVW